MRKFVIFSICILLSLSAGPLHAKQTPPAELLAQQLSAMIPSYWTVSDIKITASVNTGDAVEPKIKQRFEAVASPESNLYVADPGSAEAYAPYRPIVPTLDVKATRTLYGIAQSAYSAGQWTTKVELENSVAELGKPRSLFTGPTVVRGSERAGKILELLRPDLAQLAKRQLQAAIGKLKAGYDAELRALEAAHAKAVAELKAEQAGEKHKHKLQLQSLKAAHAAEIGRAMQAHKNKLKALNADQAAGTAREKAAYQAKLNALEADYKDNLAALHAKHEAGLKRSAEKHRQKMARITAKYDQAVEALELEIKKTSKLIALQETKKQNEEKLAAAQASALETREKQNEKLLVEFRKGIASDDIDSRRAVFAAAIKSDNSLLRRTALQAAFKSDDPVLQATAIHLGLKSDNNSLRRIAVAAGLASDDAGLHRMALEAALNSHDSGTQNMGLTEFLSNKKTLNGFVATGADPMKKSPLTIKITKFDPGTGTLTAEVPGYRYCDHPPLIGGLTGISITLSSKRGCALLFKLSDAGKMAGTYVDERGDKAKARLSLPH